ncbi:hypothetical protein LOAG_07074 [Loa loa]|uniref:Uncharacterized protein n=3 Tax=Loa loa TaxID=7209 RepID=A0A1S0TXC1_LOALO|nr:hypothetical protein LOAG_07074 [Loa loa]EFO21416.2 hypothetical protein LOAG_07074 [Loa loa]
MEGINLEGFIYDCSQNAIRTIYCSVIGEVYIDETTEVISRSRKPNVGMWCSFRASYQKNGRWFARKIILMAYPRLKCIVTEDSCIVKGTAVVCNLNGDSGYLWNDCIGLIAIEGQVVYQLKPLTAVEFQAVPFRKNGTPAYFSAKEINVESQSIFQSEILIFVQKAEIKADGRAFVSDCAITLLDIAYSARPIVGTTMSILYYRAYNDGASGIGIYATNDSNAVAGIRDDFFTTKRYFETCTERTGVEQFEDARENLNITSSDQSSVIDDEISGIQIDISESLIGSNIEFAEAGGNNPSSKAVVPLADDSNHSMNQCFESCSSFNSLILNNKLDSGDKFSFNTFAKEEMVDQTVMICNGDSEFASSSKDNVPIELKKEFMELSEEDIWDSKFIEHISHKMKDVQRTQGENGEKCNDINRLIDQSQNVSENKKEEFRDESKDHAEESWASTQHTQNIGIEMKDDVGCSPILSVTNQTMSGMDSKMLTSLEEDISVAKGANKWIEEVNELCVKVLSNARLRNFVSVNENGNALLRDIMHYLKQKITIQEVNEELGIPLSEVTPECFNIVLEERALEICRKFMEMNGFERIANSRIPKIPEEIRKGCSF